MPEKSVWSNAILSSCRVITEDEFPNLCVRCLNAKDGVDKSAFSNFTVATVNSKSLDVKTSQSVYYHFGKVFVKLDDKGIPTSCPLLSSVFVDSKDELFLTIPLGKMEYVVDGLAEFFSKILKSEKMPAEERARLKQDMQDIIEKGVHAKVKRFFQIEKIVLEVAKKMGLGERGADLVRFGLTKIGAWDTLVDGMTDNAATEAAASIWMDAIFTVMAARDIYQSISQLLEDRKSDFYKAVRVAGQTLYESLAKLAQNTARLVEYLNGAEDKLLNLKLADKRRAKLWIGGVIEFTSLLKEECLHIVECVVPNIDNELKKRVEHEKTVAVENRNEAFGNLAFAGAGLLMLDYRAISLIWRSGTANLQEIAALLNAVRCTAQAAAGITQMANSLNAYANLKEMEKDIKILIDLGKKTTARVEAFLKVLEGTETSFEELKKRVGDISSNDAFAETMFEDLMNEVIRKSKVCASSFSDEIASILELAKLVLKVTEELAMSKLE